MHAFFVFFLVAAGLLLTPLDQTQAGENSTYDFSWLDPDKEVYVLQNKKYRKKGRFYFQAGGGMTLSGPFVDTHVYHGRAGIFFTEDWGVEVLYSNLKNNYNQIAESVRKQHTVPFTREVSSYYGGLLLWSPFYAKLNAFNKIFYQDLILGVGFGKSEDKNNRLEFRIPQDTTQTAESHNTLLWSVGLRTYITEHFTIRLDAVGYHYKAEFPNASSVQNGKAGADEQFNNYDLLFSLGFVI